MTELVAAPVEGFRLWLVIDGWLQGVAVESAWVVGMQARCTPMHYFTIPSSHTAVPDPYCRCGYWIVRDSGKSDEARATMDYTALSALAGIQRRSGVVSRGWAFGLCEGWGRIVQMECGWRTEFARPTKIIVPSFAHSGLSRRYRCTVYPLSWKDTQSVRARPTWETLEQLFYRTVARVAQYGHSGDLVDAR